MLDVLVGITSLIVQSVSGLGYIGIVLLMFLESSFFPFPSEVVMIPAGYLAQQGGMDLALAIACGILGSVLGAVFNYHVSMRLGRRALIALIRRYGRYFLVDLKSFENAEKRFNENGEAITFVGRLIPGVRQYISLPPGLTRMDMGRFVTFTALGSAIWVSILALLGYYFGENEAVLAQYLDKITVALAGLAVGLLAVWLIYNYRTGRVEKFVKRPGASAPRRSSARRPKAARKQARRSR